MHGYKPHINQYKVRPCTREEVTGGVTFELRREH